MLRHEARQSIAIALGTQSADYPYSDVAEVAVLPELLASVHIRQMDFDKRNGHAQQCIPQGDAGVGEGAGIDDDTDNTISLGRVNPIDQLRLAVALLATQLMALGRALLTKAYIYIGQSVGPINLGFATTQKVEVWTMENKKFGHGGILANQCALRSVPEARSKIHKHRTDNRILADFSDNFADFIGT